MTFLARVFGENASHGKLAGRLRHRRSRPLQWRGVPPWLDSVAGRVGDIAGYDRAAAVTGVEPSSKRRLRWWVCVGALLLCVGNSLADTHVHLDEHEPEVCALCAIPEPSHVSEVARIDARPSTWRRYSGLPVVSATLATRPYKAAQPRAPPIS